MHRVLRPGGLLAISSLMFFPIHAHPWDYWRFTPRGLRSAARAVRGQLVVAQGWDLMPEGVYGIGVKGQAGLTPDRLPRTVDIARNWGAGKRVDFGPIRLGVRELWGYAFRYGREAATERARRLVRLRRER